MTYQPTEDEIRHRRDRFLQISDIYVMADRWDAYTSEERSQWTLYRQALRDLPEQAGFPFELTWPTPPITINLERPDGWPENWL